MEIGVTMLNSTAAVTAEQTVRLARLAEDLGYAAWWAGEHVVLPTTMPDPPAPFTTPIIDPLVHLTYVAAVTSRIRLGTAVLILPQRNPVVLAKQVASLDVLSGGRLSLGVGAGYLEPELRAVGVDMATRGKRTDEYLDAMTELWVAEKPEFHGEFVSFEDVDAYPRPAQAGGPPIAIGGHSPGAFRRVVSRGHAWLGIGTPDDLVRHRVSLERAATEVDRPDRLGRLKTYFLPMPLLTDPAEVKRYEDLGVDQLVLYPDVPDVPAYLEKFI
jgi:probable F420-dependent oxidoreductase